MDLVLANLSLFRSKINGSPLGVRGDNIFAATFFSKHAAAKLQFAYRESTLTKIFISTIKFYIIMHKDSLMSQPQNFLQ